MEMSVFLVSDIGFGIISSTFAKIRIISSISRRQTPPAAVLGYAIFVVNGRFASYAQNQLRRLALK